MTRGTALAGRKILVTGAASGMGAATARLMAAEGAKLVLADIASTEVLAAELGATPLVMDVRDEAAVKAGMAAAAAAMGGLDGVVNAAGVTALSRLEDTSLETWRWQIDTNLTGVFLVCREAAPYLKAAGAGTIVTIASASGLAPSMASAAYGASKAGVIMLSKALARELGPGIRVNAVCPGMVDTPMFHASVPERTPEFEAKLKADYVMGRVAEPEEIARTILFLTGPDSSFITGTAMAVDGGRVFH